MVTRPEPVHELAGLVHGEAPKRKHSAGAFDPTELGPEATEEGTDHGSGTSPASPAGR